jgi:hypothetical protein
MPRGAQFLRQPRAGRAAGLHRRKATSKAKVACGIRSSAGSQSTASGVLDPLTVAYLDLTGSGAVLAVALPGHSTYASYACC